MYISWVVINLDEQLNEDDIVLSFYFLTPFYRWKDLLPLHGVPCKRRSPGELYQPPFLGFPTTVTASELAISVKKW